VAFDQSFPPQTFIQPESITISSPVPAGSHILFIIQPPGPAGGGSTGLQAVVQLFDANNAPSPALSFPPASEQSRAPTLPCPVRSRP